MSASSPSSSADSGDSIFGSVSEVLLSVDRLHRIAHIDAALPHGNDNERQKALVLVSQFWERIHPLLAARQEVQEEISAQIKRLPCQLQSLYSDRELLIQKYAPFFFSDKQSLIVPPMRQSKRGNKGPTFLVDYQWVVSPRAHALTHESYVAKWTDRKELIGNRIYQE